MAARKKRVLTPKEQLDAALVPESEWSHEVPENWCWTRLGSITEVVGGGTPSTRIPEYYDDGDIPWLSPADLSDYHGMYISRGAKNISSLGLSKSSARLMPAGTVCLSTRAPIGYVAIAENNISTNQGFKSFLPSKCFIPEYLYWYLKANKAMLESRASGTTFLELSGRQAKLIDFPLPPLPEQRRIASRIEWLFAKLDDAEAELREVIDGSEQRRATTLHRAFTGELTKDWRGNHLSTRDEWKIVRYSSLGSSKLGKMLDRAKNAGEDTPYLRNINVRWFDYQLSDLASMRASEQEREIYSVKPGDLLICEGGEPGRCAVWKGEAEGLIFQKALHRFRPNEDVSSDYIAYYLYYLSLSDGLAKYFTGTTIKHLTGKSLAKIEISLPPVEEQNEIVRLLDALMQREKDASSLADKALIQIQELRATILDKALRGELGTNDPGEPSSKELLANMLSGNTD